MGARILFVKGGKPGTPGLSRRVITDRLGRQITHWIRFDQGRAANNPDQLALDFMADPYAAVEIRPETAPEQLEAGRSAIDDLRRQVGRLRDASGSTATLLAVRLLKDFVATGGAQLIGQKVSGPGDLATLAQVYRDPRLETFRCFYLKGDKVVGECAYSSRLPGAVQLPNAFSDNMKADMERFGADSYYLMHNHPSGSAVPSTADVYLTKYVHKNVPGMRSHVIIDHNEYATIDGEGKPALFKEPALEAVNFHADPAVDHPMLGGVLISPKDVALAAKALQMDGELSRSPVLILTKGGEARVQLMVSVPQSVLAMADKKGARWQAWVRGLGRASGAGSNAFIVVSDRDYEAAQPALRQLIKDGVVIDAVSASGKSLRDTTTPAARRLFDTRGPGRKVAETSGRYGADQLGLELRAPTGGDQVVAFPYASGMSRRRDMDAAIESAAGLGTEIGELSDRGMTRIAEAVAEGKPVFVDSGAFNAFKRAMREGTPELSRLDFERVFAKYNELSRRVREHAEANEHSRLNHGLLMMVAPDVIGDQKATLELIEEHADQIAEWIEAGHEVIVPFQKGPIDQYEAFMRVHTALGGAPFVVGIPSAAEALSTADLRQLLSQPYKPDRIHVLGAISSKRMEERMAVIRDAYVEDVPGVTADAMVMRSKLHELGGLEGQAKFDKIKEILDRVVPEIWGGTLSKSFLEGNDDDGYFTAAVIFAKADLDQAEKAEDLIRRHRGEPTPEQAKSGNYPKRAMKWQGLTIRIENEAGSIRRGVTESGMEWEVRMTFPYGEFSRTEGVDGDPVDVIVGPDLEAPMVYVVHQRRHGDWENYDEDKVCIGFDSEGSATAAFLSNYNDPRFLGPVTAMPVAEFIAKVKATRKAPAMIKAVQVITRKDGVAQRYHVSDEPKPEDEQMLADDMEAQIQWLEAQATGMGYAGVEDMVANNYPAFETLAAKWREDHPVDVALKSFAEELLKARVGPYIRQGKLVNLAGYDGKSGRAEKAPGQVDLFADVEPAAAPVKQTDTPQFREWFGDSKVVRDGEPLRMYHASYRDFDTFDRRASVNWRRMETMDTVGSWFSDNPGRDGGAGMYASGEGAVMYPVYLSIQKPKFYATFDEFLNDMHTAAGRDPAKQNPKGRGTTEELRAKLKAEGYDGIRFGKTYTKQVRERLAQLAEKVREAKDAEWAAPKKDRARLTERRMRYEDEWRQVAAKLRNNESTEFDNQEVWIAFEPEQIKSAIGNNGDFSKESPVITKSMPILFLKAKHRGDDRTLDMFGTHVETRTRKDGVTQGYRVANPKAKNLESKSPPVVEDRAEMIKEHERLVQVLESPSHEDDKAEAKRQREELEEYKQGAEDPQADSQKSALEDLGFRSDIPKQSWLDKKVEYAKEKGKDRFGVPYMGTVTGSFRKEVRVPVSVLAKLRGMRGEQDNVRHDDLDAIKKIMSSTGKLPLTDSGKEYAPFLNVAYDGTAWVNEGNHRIMAAAALGWDSLPVEIRYFDGGELVESGPLHPGKIAEFQTRPAAAPMVAKVEAVAPSKAQQTRSRRQAVLDVLGDGWTASAGVDGARDAYRKVFTNADGGKVKVLIMPQKSVDGNFYIGAYNVGGSRPGAGGMGFANTIEEAKAVAEKLAGAGKAAPKVAKVEAVKPSEDLEKFIKVAADSIDQLRRVDVMRVLESNGTRKVELARYIADKRPDLAQEVKDVMKEEFGIKDWQSPQSEDPAKLKAAREMVKDLIRTQREMGKPVGEHLIAKLAELDAKLGPEEKPAAAPKAKQAVDMTGWSDGQKAAYALRQEYEANRLTLAENKQAMGAFKRKLRAVAKTIHEDDEKAVMQIDGLATKIWGSDYNPKVADVEFGPASTKRDPQADYKAAVRSTKQGPTPEEAANPRRKFYVTIAREGRGVALLAGPFETHDEALAMVDRAKEKAYEVDPKSHFDAFGTSGVESDNHKPGVLNDQLGLGVLQPVASDDSHPAPIPRMSIAGLPEGDRERWKALHREQHETRYWHMANLKKEMDRHQGAINRAIAEYDEQKAAAEDPLMQLEPSRAAAHKEAADKAFKRYEAALAKKEAAVSKHKALHARMTALGKEKDKIAPRTGDLDYVWSADRYRDTAESQDYAREAFKDYADHYRSVPAASKVKVVSQMR